MDFDDRARLDSSQVQDRRGGRGGGLGGGLGGLGGVLGGGGGFGPGFGGRSRRRGRGVAVGGGGGVVGLILLVVVLALQSGGGSGGSGDFLSSGSGSRTGSATSDSDLGQRCRTGADADRDEDCRVVAVVNSLQTYWQGVFREAGQRYTDSDTQLFSGQTTTGCGSATSAVGPFYCPADDTVYVDLGFFDELRTTYGAQGGDFAQAYVLAHEYGHHVQDLLGTSARAQQSAEQEGPQGASTRLELQADCFAGAWAANAQRDGFVTFDDTDVREGLSAAAAVGDDRIQERATGRVDPESWTHGSAEQRQAWFRKGLASGDPGSCDTFSGRV